MISVVLSQDELHQAAAVGVRRHVEAITSNRKDAYGFDGEDGWTKHVEGACGELAVAKALGRFWGGSVNTFKQGGDVGRLQVRTRSRDDYDLLVRPDARDDDYYILVIGRAPRYAIVGWIQARDAKRPEYLKTHGGRPGAYFVPKNKLRAFSGTKTRRPA